MKVFDFSAGKKGVMLGESWSPTALYPHPTVLVDGQRKYVTIKDKTILGKEANVDLHEGACKTYKDAESEEDYLPKRWGVSAILFCMGKFKAGSGIVWEWVVVAEPEWINARIGTLLEARE